MFFNREIKKILIVIAKNDFIEVISTLIMYTTMSELSKHILGVFSVALFTK